MKLLEIPEWGWIALIAAGIGFVLWTLPILWRLGLARLRRRRRLRRAFAGESNAEHLLSISGYQLIRRQPKQSWFVLVDGTPQRIELRADLLVEKKGRRFIAEVKTGSQAPHIKTSSTRRQLLEYRLAYDVDGVLLLDMEHEVIREIGFPINGDQNSGGMRTAQATFVLFFTTVFLSWLVLSDLSLLRKLIEHLNLFFP